MSNGKKTRERYGTLFQKFRFMCMRNGWKRAEYLKKNNILAEQGEGVYFYSRKLPADPKLLKLHNNVIIATEVSFINHDRIDLLIRGMGEKQSKRYGCIEVMDNVFIGANAIILPNVKIGPNAIIAAGSIVTKDVLPGTIVGGNPAKVIGNFDEHINMRREMQKKEKLPSRHDKLWNIFNKNHSK